ncbi:MAG: hypothetical protein WA970_23865, partial [Gammaproteobacteria bacterium]
MSTPIHPHGHGTWIYFDSTPNLSPLGQSALQSRTLAISAPEANVCTLHKSAFKWKVFGESSSSIFV